MKKVEDDMGFEGTSLPDKHNCTLADLYSGHYNVCSISKETLSRPDVAIMVVLCCGPGGISHGAVRKMGKMHLITALAIDCDPLSCATHELSHPHIPVVKYEMGEWDDTLAMIYRYVPKVLMSKTYIHVSNSCRQASTGNITFRDLNKAQGDTDWYLALLSKTRCVAWTLENVPSLLRKYEGVYPTSRVYQMNEYCAIGQSRKRMILSNISLNIPRYTGKVVTTRDILGDIKEWKGHEKYWQRNSYGDARSIDTPSFTVTGGAHHIGARTLGEMQMEHIPGWRERAMLQSLKPEAVRFPPKTTETQKRQLVASVVPPLFAACLSKAVFPHLSMGVQKHNMRSMVTSLAVRTEEEIDSAFFLKGGSGRGGEKGRGEERKLRLTAKESASASQWLENEGISSYSEAALLFEGATDTVERENELLRKQWPEGDIESVARLFKVSHSTSPASATQTKSESVVVGPKSILKPSDVKVMKGFRNGSMTVGDGEPWEKGYTWSTHHLGEWVFAGPALGWYRRDTTSLSEHRKLVAQEPEMVIDDPPCTDATPSIWHMARAMRAAEKRGRMKETWGMSQEDTKSTQPVSRQVEEWAERNMRNIAKTYITKVDANALLQESDPEHYGPYLEEGESYQTPRTAENVEKACKEMGVYTMMDDSEQEFFRSLVYRHWRLFDDKLRSVHGVELSFAFPGVKPIAIHPHRWSPVKREAAQRLIEGFVKDGIMSPVQSEWGFPGVLAPKPGNDPPYRLCIDLRKLNEICPKDTYEPPSCDDCLAWLADRPFRTTMDARWGFHQLNLSEETRKVFTLVTSFGTYCYNRLVMGWVNATAEFQRHMNVTIGDALWRCAIVMVDDICVASQTVSDHKAHLEEVFARLASRGHSLKPKKVRLLQEEVEYLGHVSTPQGIKITPGQRDAIIKMPYPLNSEGEVDETRLRSFIGLASFSRRYINNVAMHAHLLNG